MNDDLSFLKPKDQKQWRDAWLIYDTSIPFLERKHVRDGLAILNSIEALAKSKQAKMLVLLIAEPGPSQWTDEIREYQKILSSKGIDSFDLSQFETPEWRFAAQGHWNIYGSGLVADKVFDFIKEKRLLELTD